MTVILFSPYEDRFFMQGLEVRVQGLKDTNTEGIDRTQVADPVHINFPDYRTFDNLLPGRYRITVNGVSTGPFLVKPHFFGELLIEIGSGTIVPFDWPEIGMNLEATPVTVRCRLFAADEQADIEGEGPSIFSSLIHDIIYDSKTQTDIEFNQFESDNSQYLKVVNRMVTVDTDQAGKSTVHLRSGRYGIQISSMDEYWGSHVHLNDLTDDDFDEEQGWPYVQNWPYPSTPNNGDPLTLRYGHEYELDIFVRRQEVAVRGLVLGEFADPTKTQAIGDSASIPYNDIALGGGMAVLNDLAGGATMAPLFNRGEAASQSLSEYEFKGIGPGNYSLSITHPRNSFETSGGDPTADIDIPTWDAPGVLPSSSPQAIILPLQTVIPGGTQTFEANFADGGGSLIIEQFVWDTNSEPPDYNPNPSVHDPAIPRIIQPDYIANDIWFRVNIGTLLPNSGFDFWWQSDPDNFYMGTSPPTTHQVFKGEGGTSNNTVSTLLSVPYNLILASVAEFDSGFPVPGTKFTFEPGAGAVEYGAPTTLIGYEDNYIPASITNPNWQVEGHTIEVTDPSIPEILITARLSRGLALNGTVETDTVPDVPIEGATVLVLDRFGNLILDQDQEPIGRLESGANGSFQLPQALNSAAIVYVDVQFPGFVPWRKRFTPADATDPGSGDLSLTVNARLKALPSPEFVSTTFNRHGLFLPGVKRTGNEILYFADPADDTLDMTWELIATSPPFTYDLPTFDTAAGDPGPLQNLQISDKITEVWLVDARSFPTNPYDDHNPKKPKDDETDPPANDPVTPASLGNLRQWLKDISDGTIPNVFVQKISVVEELANDEYRATDEIEIDELPPGFFRPLFVMQTARGATATHLVEYTGALEGKELQGARLPPWLAFVTDFFATLVATPDPVKETLAEKVMPKGRFIAMPSFTAMIELDGANPGYLHYQYGIAVEVSESMDTPASGMLGFAPGIVGLQFNASADVHVRGKEREVELKVMGSATTIDDVDITEYFPKKLGGLDVEDPFFRPVASVSTASTEFLDPNNKLEAQLRHVVNGTVLAGFKVNLRPFTSKIPYAGPVLLALDKTGQLRVLGTLDGAISLESQTTWTTKRPQDLLSEGSVLYPTDHTRRSHFLGGDENFPATGAGKENKFEIGFNFGVGMEIQALSRLTANGRIALQGEEKTIPGLPDPVPVATILLNTDGDWPLLKKIQGSLNLSLGATLDVGIAEFSKDWSWDLITFSKEFGTAPVFQLIPMTITLGQAELDDFPPVSYSGLTPHLISDFLPMGSYSTSPGSQEAVLFTDIHSDDTNMALKAAFRTGDNTWGSPVTVSDAPGILGSALGQLQNGQWIAAWVELAAGTLDDPFAPTTIKEARSTDATGQVWDAASEVVSLTDSSAQDLCFIIGSNLVGLIFLENGGGPTSNQFSISGTTWDGESWNLQTQILGPTNLLGFDATGTGPTGADTGQVIYTDSLGDIYAKSWNGTSPGAAQLLDSGVSGVLSLGAGPSDTFYSAYGLADGGIGLHKFESGWTDLGDPFPLAVAGEVEVEPLIEELDTVVVLCVWVTPGDSSQIEYGFTDTSGTVLTAETGLTNNTAGDYHHLSVIPEPDNQEAVILSLFRNNPDELRVFNLSFANGTANNDRDGDAINDIGELLVVDDIPDDGQFDTIESVLPASDYDLDGVDNATEIMAGTDPTDPLDFPESAGVIIQATVPDAFELANSPGQFSIIRPSDNIISTSTVNYTVTGSATPDTDYTALSGSIMIPANATEAILPVNVFADNEVEGDETVTATLMPGPYTIGSPDNATITIKDPEIDDWRSEEFVDPNSPEAQDEGDGDDDGIPTVLEFALFLDPNVPDTMDLPDISTEMDQSSGEEHLTLTYTRRITEDLIFIVEVTNDLENGDWHSNIDGSGEIVTEEVMRVDNGNGTETVETRSTMTVPDDNSLFMRLKVTR